MEKLRLIQNELKAPKNQRNNFGKYNYRSCEDILEAVKPLLSKHKCTLTISDEIKELGNILFVEAIAVISDGQSQVHVKAQAGIDPNRKGMDIAQSFGSWTPIDEAFCNKTAALVSSSGGSITTGNPHPSLDFNLSSSPSISLGYLSQVSII